MHTYFLSSRGPASISAEEFIVARDSEAALKDHVTSLARKLREDVKVEQFLKTLDFEALTPRAWQADNPELNWNFLIVEVD